MTFDTLTAEFGAYSKDGTDYAIQQTPYLEYIAGSSSAYVVQGQTYYTAIGYDRAGNPFRLWWEITNPDTEDESEACNWDVFEAQPISADSAPWHPEMLA